MTECSQQSFEFNGHFSRQVTARFDGGQQTSDAGGLLLREADRLLNLLPRFAACFMDGRDPNRVEHPVQEMVSQRVYGMALGYEDLNDHEQLRQDPLLAVMSGRSDIGSALAGKSTLNRLELSGKKKDRYKKIICDTAAVDRLLVDVFLESYAEVPDQIVRWIWMQPTLQSMAGKKDVSSMVSTITTVICRSTFSATTTCWLPVYGNPISMDRPDRWRK
jgi:hypothetical protein